MTGTLTLIGAGKRYDIHDFTQVRTLGKPITIDGIPTAELLEAYKLVTAYEVEFYVEEQFWSQVIISEYALRLCGLDTTDGVTMSFEEDGKGTEYHYDFVPIVSPYCRIMRWKAVRRWKRCMS